MRCFYLTILYLVFFYFSTKAQNVNNAGHDNPQLKKPLNVLFFLVDDLGWKDLGYAGNKFYETPNIDALAKDSKIFSRAYAACPVCSPTRASIMTGKLPVRTGITDYIGAPAPEAWKRNTELLPAAYADRLALEEVTIAEALKNGGYETFFAGKWHLGPEGFWPEDQGFDINKGGINKGNPGKGYFAPYNNSRLAEGPAGQYLPERLSDETSAYIRSRRGAINPFFVFHSFYLVHTPLLAKEALIAKYERKKDSLKLKDKFEAIGKDVYDASKDRMVRASYTLPVYAAMVEALDQAVGKIVHTLKETGMYDETLIIFTSDNGGLSTSEGLPTSNFPLKGGKGWAYEGGIREPLIIRWPGVTKAGTASNEVVVSTDYYPTILQAAGLPMNPKQHIDGKSLLPVLEGEKIGKRKLFWHYPHYGNQGGSPFSAVMAGDLKLIKYYQKNGYYELYNVTKDASEKNNILHTTNSAVVNQLKGDLQRFLQETNAELPTVNPDYSLKK
ncbi:MAG: sulfatase [Sphingobacteriaceae bacterium]